MALAVTVALDATLSGSAGKRRKGDEVAPPPVWHAVGSLLGGDQNVPEASVKALQGISLARMQTPVATGAESTPASLLRSAL